METPSKHWHLGTGAHHKGQGQCDHPILHQPRTGVLHRGFPLPCLASLGSPPGGGLPGPRSRTLRTCRWTVEPQKVKAWHVCWWQKLLLAGGVIMSATQVQLYTTSSSYASRILTHSSRR